LIPVKHICYLNELGQRAELEDSIFPAPGKATLSDRLFLVCDGVGGEHKGEEASRIACESFARYFLQFPPVPNQVDPTYITLAQAFVLEQLAAYASLHPEAARMSTTLALVYLDQERVTVAWCGDSRIYHLRKGKAIWHSTDHSFVSTLVQHGEITEKEARFHPQKNIITRSLSAAGPVSQIDLRQLEDIQPGDYLLLCTDGLLEQIEEERLAAILDNPNENKAGLFMAYCRDKTRDNFSMYLITLSGQPEKTTFSNKKGWLMVFIVLLLLAFTAVWWFLMQAPAHGPVKHHYKNYTIRL